MNPSDVIFDIERSLSKTDREYGAWCSSRVVICPCIWCQNPESHEMRPQVMYYRNECIACGRCVEACPESAIRDTPGFGFVTEHQTCSLCGSCIGRLFYQRP
jgi:pyruvate formate lyase activating enzyme